MSSASASPKKTPHRALHFGELAEQPLGEIDQMRALVDEFATPGDRALEAPLLLIARSAAVTISPAYEQERSDLAPIDDRARPRHRRVEAVIVADLCDAARGGGGSGDRLHLREVASAGLFDQHMLARVEASRRDSRKLGVRRCNHHRVNIGRLDRDAKIGRRSRSRARSDPGGTLFCKVDGEHSLMAEPCDGGGSFLPDKAAPDDGEPHVTRPG